MRFFERFYQKARFVGARFFKRFDQKNRVLSARAPPSKLLYILAPKAALEKFRVGRPGGRILEEEGASAQRPPPPKSASAAHIVTTKFIYALKSRLYTKLGNQTGSLIENHAATAKKNHQQKN